jgi:hypothetical protein
MTMPFARYLHASARHGNELGCTRLRQIDPDSHGLCAACYIFRGNARFLQKSSADPKCNEHALIDLLKKKEAGETASQARIASCALICE